MRLNDQQTFDEEAIATTIERGNMAPVIQFSEQAAYDDSVLTRINHLCQRFGSEIHVRFYGHYGGHSIAVGYGTYRKFARWRWTA